MCNPSRARGRGLTTIFESATRATGSAGAEVTRSFVELAKRRVSYLTAGDPAGKPTLLLIHGSGVSARYWINQLQGLGGVLRVVAVDLPGHGESDPMPYVSVEEYGGVVANLVDALGLGTVIAAGHSLGGAIALASQQAGRVRGLVLLASCVKLAEVDGWGERFLAYLPGPLRKLLFFSMAKKSMAKKLLFATGAPGGAVAVGMRELRAWRPETILKDVHAAKAMDLTGPATRLEVPTLILVGSQDRLTTPALAQHLRELIPGSLLRIHEGAGHMLLLEVPEWVNREVLDFVSSMTAPAEVSSSRAIEGQRKRSLVQRFLGWVRRIAPWLTL